MALTTVTIGQYVEFDHPETGRVTYGYVVAVGDARSALIRTDSGTEVAMTVLDLYDPERPAYAAAA